MTAASGLRHCDVLVTSDK